MEHPFLYTIEEIFGNKVNSTIRMYAIKIVSNFFHLIFHFTVKICFLSLLLNCFASIHFFVTYWEKTFDRPRRCVCQVYSSAPAILQKPSRGSMVSRPLIIHRFIREGGGHLSIFWVGMCRPGLQIGTRSKKAICPWIISNGCLRNWSFRASEILYPVLENASEMDTPF